MNKHELMLHELDDQLTRMLYPKGRTVELQPLSDYKPEMGEVLVYNRVTLEAILMVPYYPDMDPVDSVSVWRGGGQDFTGDLFCELPKVTLPAGLD